MSKSKIIKVDYLARVEGEGGLYIRVKENKVEDVKLKIFEPPRFFEGFLRGRNFSEAPDITARVCGICPVAYQMSACHALEYACGITVDGPLRDLRRLLYCGEWIESHVLHIFLLHAPDFLGFESAIAMAKDHGDLVRRALQLKKIGNEIMTVVGGREIHPVNVRLGGFYKTPDKAQLRELLEPLKWARDQAWQACKWVASLPFPEFDQDYEFVALQHPCEYPINEGRLVSNKGLDISVQDYQKHFVEKHVAHSNALHSIIKVRANYFVGPLARFNLNCDRLSSLAQQAAQEAGLRPGCQNPFKSIIARAVETVYACDEALRIIEHYEEPETSFVEFKPKAGIGCACTEAPRGILYHRYRIDEKGLIQEAKIVPPTSQNQKTIESDLTHLVPTLLNEPKERLTWLCEQAVRNYDPCISCATHFLKLHLQTE